MLLYDLTLPRKEICDEKELYVRGGVCRDNGVFVKGGETVTFDTYFNSFSHIKYKKYTDIKDVAFRLEVDGSGVLSLYKFDESGDVVIAQSRVDKTGEICFDINAAADGGFVYAAFKADGDAVLRSGGWYTDAQGRDVKLGIVICTYKREEFVKRNITQLADCLRNSDDKFFDVLVVDNGKTLGGVFEDGIRIIPNENTGGSGGFTRGIKEVCQMGGYTHFLLMDDDIVFDTAILRRTASLLSILKDEYKNASIGGAMLVLGTPWIQLEMGADWNGVKIVSHRKRKDIRKRIEIALNEEDGEFDYNGWFYTCMPVTAVEKYGYPLPFFIKCDDLEYGLRACENIIAMSGIAVRHEDFNIKYTPGIEYFTNRNELILNSRFPKGKGFFANWKKLIYRVGYQLILQRYYSVDLIFKAYDDFFKGPEFAFASNGAEVLEKVRKDCPQFLTEDELKEKYGISIDRKQMSKKTEKRRGLRLKHILTLNGYLVPKCFYKKGMAQVDVINFNFDGLYMKREVLQFNPVTNKGFVTKIRQSQLWKTGFRLVGYFFKLMFKYRSTAKKYLKFDNFYCLSDK